MKPTSSTSSNAWIWVVAMLLLVAFAGGAYLWLHDANSSRAPSVTDTTEKSGPSGSPDAAGKPSDVGTSTYDGDSKPLPEDDQSKQTP